MTVVIPRFRSPGADYVFLANASGSIIAVVYPSGDAFLYQSDAD
jgi:hypothetical protein